MKERFHFLQTLRGVAALLVFLGHYLDMYYKHNNTGIEFVAIGDFVSSLEIGRIGVVVFFLISGFVLPYSLKNRKNDYTVSHFLVKSTLRLYPAFLFSIVVAVLVGSGVGININSLQQVMVNVTMIPKFLGSESVQGAYWTLHLLFVFYILVALIFWVNKIVSQPVYVFFLFSFLLIALVFSMVRYYFDIRLPIVFPLGIATMLIGVLIRQHHSEEGRSTNLLILYIIIYLSALYGAQSFYYQGGMFRWYFSYVIGLFVFVNFVYFVRHSNRVLTYIGKISYSMYLQHMLVLALVFNSLGLYPYSITGFAVSIVICFILTLAISSLSYYLFESKVVSMVRRVNNIGNVKV